MIFASVSFTKRASSLIFSSSINVPSLISVERIRACLHKLSGNVPFREENIHESVSRRQDRCRTGKANRVDGGQAESESEADVVHYDLKNVATYTLTTTESRRPLPD